MQKAAPDNLNKKLKKEYYHNKLQNCGNHMKKSWKILKDLLPKKKKDNANANIKIESKISSDKRDIATAFNELLVKAGELNSCSDEKKGVNALNTLLQSSSLFKFSDVKLEFVLNELRKLDPTKVMGPDNLSPRLLQVAAPFIANPLTKLFNKSLSSGNFPEDFKKAKIIPVPKGGDLTDIGNYRPIFWVCRKRGLKNGD